jgi:hypothetical protein
MCISTGTLAPEDNLREILTEIGIRPDSPWGKIILDHSPRGQAFRQAWFPSEFYLELHLRRMRERYDRLDEESQRRLQEASPIVFAFRRPNPPLTFIYPPLFLKQYGKLIDGAERDPRRVLPAPKGVTKEQLTAIICRESDREKIIRLAQEKEVKAEVIGIEQYLEQAPERAIDFCERRYQSTAEHAPFTHHTLLQWIREGSCVPLVGGREGMKIGVYSPSEFLEFKQELQSNPFSFLGR